MKKKIINTLLLAGFLFFGELQAQQVLDKVVAVVEDEIILASELSQFSLNLAFQMGIDPRKDPEKFQQLQSETLQNLINQKILLAKADEDSVEVDERQVDNYLENQIASMVQRVGSEEKLEEQLGMAINKIKRTFRDEVRKNLRVEMLRNIKYNTIQITRREVNEFYNTMKDSLPNLKETVDISHILLTVKAGESSEGNARKRIEQLRERVKSGENFEELCRQFSEDPGSKARGGELGLIQRGDFVPEFEEVAFMLEPGEFSDIVKTRFGYHLIECLDRKGDKINVRHLLILLQPTQNDEQATISKINEIRAELDKPGADFAEIAKKYSDDETTKEQGGHLGLFEIHNLQEKEFKHAIESLEAGQVSQPFKTNFGWHILKLNSREDARKISVEKDWDKIESWALNIKRQKEFQEWVEEIKKDVYVDVKVSESELEKF